MSDADRVVRKYKHGVKDLTPSWDEADVIANGERCYELGVQDSMLRATQYERILTDLIAELRAHSDHAVPVDTLVLESWADRAEQRLKEVTGHE